ncbi:MAG: putative toxin-antitoxin system toxin component, PIN family [Sarcina sp.]
MRVVLDTNVFIEAFFSSDENCSLILRAEHDGEINLIMSSKMHEELLRIINKLIHELEFTSSETFEVFKLLSRALLRTENITPKKRFTKCEDKDDNIFFDCAIEGNANFIVSRDKHLHDVQKKHTLKNSKNEAIKVLYPDEFIMVLKKIKLVANFNNK